jgi:hypothetical protein
MIFLFWYLDLSQVVGSFNFFFLLCCMTILFIGYMGTVVLLNCYLVKRQVFI